MNSDARLLPFVCTECGRRAPNAGDCACGAGSLIDLSKPEFREMAIETDDRRAEAHQQRLLWAGVAAGILGGGMFVAIAFPLIKLIPLPVPFALPIKVMAILIASAVLSSKVLGEIWQVRRRFPELIAARTQGANGRPLALPARLRAPSKATLIGIGAFVALGIAINVGAPYVKEWSEKEEGDHRAEVEKRATELHDCVMTHNPDAVFSTSTRNDEWTQECKKPLERLYESLDGRNEDLPLVSPLETEFACKSKCKPTVLAKHYDQLYKSAVDRGIPLAPLRSRPTRAGSPWERSDLGSPAMRNPRYGAFDTRDATPGRSDTATDLGADAERGDLAVPPSMIPESPKSDQLPCSFRGLLCITVDVGTIAIHLSWPFRDDRGQLAARFERTLVALRPLGLRSFREGSRPFDTARRFDVAKSAQTMQVEAVGFERGRPRGVLRADLLLRAPTRPSRTSELRIEHEIPARPAATIELMRELLEIWSPLWGASGEVADAADGAPVVGWLTFLSSVYGSAPAGLASTEISGRGTLYEAKCAGTFERQNPAHKLAVTRMAEELRRGQLLLPLGALLERDLGWQDEDWRTGAERPIWHLAQQAVPAPKVPSAMLDPLQKAPTLATPTYAQSLAANLPRPSVSRNAPLRTPVDGRLPISADLDLYAAFVAALELAPEWSSEVLSLCGIDTREHPGVASAWARRFENPAVLAQFTVKRDEYRAALTRILAGAEPVIG